MLDGKKAKLVLIYSDLSQNLGLSTKSIEELCNKYGMLIEQKL
jgi:ribosomal protein L7Ae-like RNA K-turn-binding protein